jgi:selenocysteine lyase/cysteine desulfurase/rhodanese-related sulfurtransferase
MGAPPTYDDLVREALGRVRTVAPDELLVARAKAKQEGRRLHVLDVREGDELESVGIISGATHLPRGLVELHAADHFEADDEIFVVCEHGNRSALVADVLQNMGFTNVVNLRGGMLEWKARKLPVEIAATSCTVPLGTELTWAEIRAEFPISRRRVPVMGGGDATLIYMDHGASTHPPARVLQRYSDFMGAEYANIHRGTHLLSRKATERFEDCYYVVSDFLGGSLDRDCVVFLTNTTQAIALAVHVMQSVPGKTVVTELEHHSNDLPHRQTGPVLRCRITENGELDMDHLARLLADHPVKLVAVSGGSNVTGYVPNLHRIAEMVHEVGARILVDAAQLLAHAPLDVRPQDDPGHLDFVAAAGHKAYAPFGASFLYGPRSLMDAAPPYLPGGGTASRVSRMGADYVRAPDRHQGGTPNIGGVIAMAEAIRFLDDIGMERIREHELALVTRALDGLTAMEGVTVYGPRDPAKRLGVISFNVEVPQRSILRPRSRRSSDRAAGRRHAGARPRSWLHPRVRGAVQRRSGCRRLDRRRSHAADPFVEGALQGQGRGGLRRIPGPLQR